MTEETVGDKTHKRKQFVTEETVGDKTHKGKQSVTKHTKENSR